MICGRCDEVTTASNSMRTSFQNMSFQKIRIREVGEILLERSRRAKHMSLSIRPFRGVRVAVPRGQSFAAAEKFAHSKTEWIKKHLKKMGSIEKQAAAIKEGRSIDKETAKKRLVNRLDALCKQNGFNYNRVFVKNQKTRWGSCSAKNNINLNMNLVRLPDELIDYVIFHELVHTKIKDHSKLFWEALSKFVKNPKSLDKKLRQYTLG
jgi:predicted metal-dependent hydrolase